MPTRITAPLILVFSLNACQREANEMSQRPNNDALLVKTVTVTGSGSSAFDTTIITYGYDANDRLEKETYLFTYTTSSGNQRLPTGREYVRDGGNRITRIKSTNRLVSNPANVITSFSNVFYVDNNSTRVSYISDDANSFKTVFIYNSNGKIEKTETFQHFPLPTDPLKMVVYSIHQYDAAGNLLSRTQFSDNDNNGVFEQGISYTFGYDAMVNPVDRNDDALFEWRWSLFSPANCIRQTNNYTGIAPVDGFTLEFQYRNDKKPEKATRAEFGGLLTGPAVTTYYYQ
jgi:hypothetical protein